MTDTNTSEIKIPNKVFIVPYRNREEQKFFFSKYMSYIMEDFTDYEIYFSHQTDNRSFNRGATKNIGFLAIKDKYPDDYKNITFIFNDVDTIPFTKIFNYETNPGVVKHYYGFKYTLGGIVAIKGEDFERINGFPNYWGWGSEDSCLQKRCEKAEIVIDRSNFFPIGSPQILHLFDGISRIINKKDPIREKNDNGIDGITSINQLQFEISEKSTNVKDNLYNVENPNIYFINISHFFTAFDYNNDSKELYNYDLREPKKKIIDPNSNRKCDVNNVVQSSESWTNIPYYPTTKERKEMISQGLKPINPYEHPEQNYNINEIPASQIYQKKYFNNKYSFQNVYSHQQQQQQQQQNPFLQSQFYSKQSNFSQQLPYPPQYYPRPPQYPPQFSQHYIHNTQFKKQHNTNEENETNSLIENDNVSELNTDNNIHENNEESSVNDTNEKNVDKTYENDLRKKIREEIELEMFNNYQNKQQSQFINKPTNIYSPYYASYMGIKPSATTSGKINFNGFMGGNSRKR
jgi:hypothetical protein